MDVLECPIAKENWKPSKEGSKDSKEGSKLHNDYKISYEDLLLKSDRTTMNVNRLRLLCIEIYKTINNLNPEFMRDLFSLRETSWPIREFGIVYLTI